VQKWAAPVLDFLWNDPDVTPRNPAVTHPEELPHFHHFPGVDQVVFRNEWNAGATHIEFDCGPYLAKHQHMDRNHFTIFHRGYLAIDSGADYTESESPHYLNYYRRTVAHNTMLVSVRSLEDWEKTRDIWDIGHLKVVDNVDATAGQGGYHYALGDATRAYSPHKLRCFTRQLLYLPSLNVLLVFDRVVSTDPAFRKTWLLHGVDMPWIEGAGTPSSNGEDSFGNAGKFRLEEGEVLVHTLLPANHVTARRGGAGYEFWTPGNTSGGAWGSGRNWPLEPAEGGSLPTDPIELAIWKKFYGDDIKSIEHSNRRNVVPGAWRVEVSPSEPQLEDHFLHLFEINDRGKTGHLRVELLHGTGTTGAGCSVTEEPVSPPCFQLRKLRSIMLRLRFPHFPAIPFGWGDWKRTGSTIWNLPAAILHPERLLLPASLCSRNKFARTSTVSFKLYLAPPLFQPPAACASTLSETLHEFTYPCRNQPSRHGKNDVTSCYREARELCGRPL
jgi:hypothetical protein